MQDRLDSSHSFCQWSWWSRKCAYPHTSSPQIINDSQQSEVLHELEIEIARPSFLLAAAAKRGDPNATEAERNAFDELIRVFVNNARILTRNSIDSWH